MWLYGATLTITSLVIEIILDEAITLTFELQSKLIYIFSVKNFEDFISITEGGQHKLLAGLYRFY